VEVTGRRTPVELPSGAELYLVNDDDLTFATTRPDPASRPVLLARASQLPSPLSRAVAVATVWDMLVNGEAAAAEVVECLTRMLPTETADAVVEPFIALAREAAELWSPDGERAAAERQVAETCLRVAEDAGRRQVALRGAARTATDVATLDQVRALAGDDVDLLWRALVRQAEIDSVDDERIDELLARDPDPDAWVRGLTVRAARPVAEEKEEVWRTVVADRKVPVASVGPVATAFWRPGQDELVRPYAARYLEVLPRLHESGMIPAMVYSGQLFPPFAVDDAFLQDAAEAAKAAAPVVGKRVVERADEVRRMLAARATSAPAP
jgi:aminopeptidase N